MASSSMTGGKDTGVNVEYQKQPTTTLGKCVVQDHHNVSYYIVWGHYFICQLPVATTYLNIAHSADRPHTRTHIVE